MSRGRVFRLALMVPVLMVLCSCGGSDDDGGSGTVTPGPGPGTGGAPVSCQTAFSPDKVNAGENCDTVVGTYCPQPDGSLAGPLVADPIACDGVTVDKRTVTAGGLSSEFLVIRPAGQSQESIYLALHYLAARNGAFSNVVRLSELAKGRNTMVLVPQAPAAQALLPIPDLLGSNLTSRWPTNVAEPIALYVQLLDAVVSSARTEFGNAGQPLYVAGLSNGAAMVYFYGCHAADRVDAILAVAGTFSQGASEACQPSRALGTVVVHGTADPVVPYNGLLLNLSAPAAHEFFKTANGCTGTDSSATIAARPNDVLPINIRYTQACTAARRDFLVTVEGGGHNWPGKKQDTVLANVGLLGAQTANFDATLQGYDLLKLAAGR